MPIGTPASAVCFGYPIIPFSLFRLCGRRPGEVVHHRQRRGPNESTIRAAPRLSGSLRPLCCWCMERGGRASVTAAAGCTAGAAVAASAADDSEAEGEGGNGVEDHVVSALIARALTRAPPRGDVVPFFRDAFRRSSRTISSPVVLGRRLNSSHVDISSCRLSLELN